MTDAIPRARRSIDSETEAGTAVGANRCGGWSPPMPARAAHMSMPLSSLPSFRSASVHTLGSDPENSAVVSRNPASLPTSRTPSALSVLRSSVVRSEVPTSCIDGRWRARIRSETSS
jgi:hypothetical protein